MIGGGPELITEGKKIGVRTFRYVPPLFVYPVIFMDPCQGSQGIDFFTDRRCRIIVEVGRRELPEGNDRSLSRHPAAVNVPVCQGSKFFTQLPVPVQLL